MIEIDSSDRRIAVFEQIDKQITNLLKLKKKEFETIREKFLSEQNALKEKEEAEAQERKEKEEERIKTEQAEAAAAAAAATVEIAVVPATVESKLPTLSAEEDNMRIPIILTSNNTSDPLDALSPE